MKNNSIDNLQPHELEQIIDAAHELEDNAAWQYLSERLIERIEMKIVRLRPEEFNKAPDYLLELQSMKKVLSFHKYLKEYKNYFGDVDE